MQTSALPTEIETPVSAFAAADGAVRCHHCGDACRHPLTEEGRHFCCEGCLQVYLLLQENGLCTYHDMGRVSGLKARGRFTDGRFGYLDDASVIARLTRFSDGRRLHLDFHLPGMHCASCIWLLENLHRIGPGIVSSRADFRRKEVHIVIDPSVTSVRKTVELLAYIGYEPDISLQDATAPKAVRRDRGRILRIGVAGFCFGNIMMLSFPEYLSDGDLGSEGLQEVFSLLNLLLALPVILFCAREFFVSAAKGLRQGWLNIDAPIALAIMMTFGRSVWEILGGTGAGYLDSMSGIVFFMLVGRWFQHHTYDAFSFDRDYRSYFPLGVTVIRPGGEENIPVSSLAKGDRILVRNGEMVPADALLMQGEASIDYSFVSGEELPVAVSQGDIVYAGGRQCGEAVELEVLTPATGSRITQLWNNEVFKEAKNRDRSYIHPWSRHFTAALLAVAVMAGLFWQWRDPAAVWPVVTSILIVACPCSLLLSATFTNGNMLRVFGRNRMYLKNASVIEALALADTVIFDKTGTITRGRSAQVVFEGREPDLRQRSLLLSLARQSAHPLSRILVEYLRGGDTSPFPIEGFREVAGEGIEGRHGKDIVRIGSASFTGVPTPGAAGGREGTSIHASINGIGIGRYLVGNEYREGLERVAATLGSMGLSVEVLSGDNDHERGRLTAIFGEGTPMRFRQSPQEKLEHVRGLQSSGRKVVMVGDGLNDAGALRQSLAGIAVTDNTAVFTPASDAILEGGSFPLLDALLRYARMARPIVTASFILSILYNFIGLGFAVRGMLSPLVAAILMPASSISIVAFVTLATTRAARRLGLSA